MLYSYIRMNPLIILIAALVLPLVLLMVLRVNAALVFMSLCLGNVLVEFVGSDAGTLLASTQARMPGHVPAGQSAINLTLLILPVVLTSLIMIHTVRGAGLAFNLLPAVGVSLLGALLAVPLLSAGTTGAITALPLWHVLENSQTFILSVSTLVSLALLWRQRPKRFGAHEGGGKHH